MKKVYFRNNVIQLEERLRSGSSRLQVLFGPRQVGKTTLARQVAESLTWPFHFATADAVGTATTPWLISQWEQARQLQGLKPSLPALLILDEVQKIPNWSEIVKKLWDEEKASASELRVVILGSSPLLMQKGLSESLAGRFEVIPVTHWTFQEMHQAFGWNLDQYIYFGGYPGSHDIINDRERWSRFILDSLIETTLSRDIFLMARIDKPALFRQLFELGCLASGQILSFQKIMGQLQEAGNASTLAGYLHLMEGAGLLAGILKFANAEPRRKASSPKFQVFNNALLTAWQGKGLEQAKADPELWGRLVESAVGAHLLNASRSDSIKLSYWNVGEKEIDYILCYREQVLALEVKSGRRSAKLSAIEQFAKQNPRARFLTVGSGGMNLEHFFSISPRQLFKD
ncbi:MAG: ATP-binding protein [Deltaproteobacteria bacterium]|nr:ATP-binding protein [Deltaproteobacteria bacterium]